MAKRSHESLKQSVRELMCDHADDTAIRRYSSVYAHGSYFARRGSAASLKHSDIDVSLVASSQYLPRDECAAAYATARKWQNRVQRSLRAVPEFSRRAPPVSVHILTEFELDCGYYGGSASALQKKWFNLRSREWETHQRLIQLDRAPDFASTVGLAITSAQTTRASFFHPDWREKLRKRCGREHKMLPKTSLRACGNIRQFVDQRGVEEDDLPAYGLAWLIYTTEECLRGGHDDFQEVFDFLVTRAGAPGERPPLTLEDMIWISEYIAYLARRTVVRTRSSILQPSDYWVDSESDLINALQRELGTIEFAGKRLECRLLPEDLWTATEGLRPDFVDDAEAAQCLRLDRVSRPLPDDLLEQGVVQLSKACKGKDTPESWHETLRRLNEVGSNAYPRLVSLSYFETRDVGDRGLCVGLGESRYGIALVTEKTIDLPAFRELRETHILNSLAVRVAYVYPTGDSGLLIEFHRRKTGQNATYGGAWDVSAAGYIDPLRHRDPEDPSRISAWRAAAMELEEELNLAGALLPFRDNFHFFGIGRNDPTGQVDLLGYCIGINPLDARRTPTERVTAYDRCEASPAAIARFIQAKRYWVPTAILTCILTLESLGYTRPEIEREFRGHLRRVKLSP